MGNKLDLQKLEQAKVVLPLQVLLEQNPLDHLNLQDLLKNRQDKSRNLLHWFAISAEASLDQHLSRSIFLNAKRNGLIKKAKSQKLRDDLSPKHQKYWKKLKLVEDPQVRD